MKRVSWDLLIVMLKRARARVSETNKLSLKGQQMLGVRVGYQRNP